MRTGTPLICILVTWMFFFSGQAVATAVPSTDSNAEWAALSGRPVATLDIEILGPDRNTDKWTDMAGDLIGIAGGNQFSPDLLRKALDHLKECGRFAKVDVDVKQVGELVDLKFRLTVNRVIRDIDIDIEGRDGVFRKDVLNAMSVNPGSTWAPLEMARQKAGIIEMLKARGFPAPSVEIRPCEDKDDYTVLLRVTTKLGSWQAIKAVRISGNRAFSGTRLKARMKTWRASFFWGGANRFIQRDLDRDIESLIKFYRKKGFAEVTASYDLKKGQTDKELTIAIQVTEGPRYKIDFSGNDRFSDRTLKKDLALFSSGNRNGMGIRKSLKNMTERYLNAGYGKVDISVEEKDRPLKDGVRKQVRFMVDEGPRTIVRSFALRGNAAIPDKEINQQVLTRPKSWISAGVYVPQVLDDDIQAIQRLYEKNGFCHARITKSVSLNKDDTGADIIVDIDEGTPVRVSSVRFEGLQAVSDKRAIEALRLKPEKLLDDESVRQDRINLAALISEKGYPHVKVDSSVKMSDDGRTADIVYQVEEGPRVEMGKIYVSGNLRTRESVVRQEMEMSEGDPFSLTRMIKSQQNLRSLDVFRAVDLTTVGLKEQDKRVDLFIETLEKKPFFIELSGGYNSEQGGVGKATVGDHNLLGENRNGYVSWEISEVGYRGDLNLRSPRFFSTRAVSTLNIYTEKTEAFNQDFGLKTRGASFGINRQWSPEFSTGINVNTERRREYPLSSNISGSETYENRNAVAVTPGLVYDTRDNGMMPTQGVLASCDVTISEGINSDPDDFVRYQGDVRYYHTLFETLTMAMIGRAGYIEATGSSNAVSDDQLFYLGGISSVRGYAENMLVFDESNDPVGGRLSLSGSIEARVPVKETLTLVLFYDIGKLDRAYTPADLKARSSVGLGLGYQTAIGPISLYYGSKLDRLKGEDPGRFHFSIGYTF